MAYPNDVLSWASLTGVVNEIKSPNQFLKRLVFGAHDPQPTEVIEIGMLSGSRVVAPFIRRNGMAMEIEGTSESFKTVSFPNIRIKKHLEAPDLMFNRRAGTTIFPGGDEIVNAAAAHVARQQQRLADAVTEAEEYLCALAIRGSIAYSVDEQEVFTITLGKPAGNSLTITTKWDDAASEVAADFFTAKQLVADEVGLGVTHAIMGAEAAAAFMANAGVMGRLDVRNLSAGQLTLMEQFNQDGAIYLGVFCGVQCWAYTRQTSVNGSAVSLIRSKHVEFLSVTPAAENVLYYGAIPDLQALQGRLFQGERFSKSWEQEDPSVRWLLVHSRPLPIPRRPGSMVSMQVLA